MKTGSLNDAAERLEIPVSSASRHLQRLETELDLTLFVRSAGGMAPTEQATAMLPLASNALNKLDEIDEQARILRTGGSVAKSLRVISFPRCTDALVVPALAIFFKSSPEALVMVETQLRRELIRSEDLSEFHLAITTQTSAAKPIWQLIGKVPLVVVVSKDDELAKEASIKVEDLHRRNMVQLRHGTLARHVTDELLAMSHAEPMVRVETSSSLHAIQLAAAGIGFFVVDALVPDQVRSHRGIAIPLETNITVDVIAKTKGGADVLQDVERLIYCLSEQIHNINKSYDIDDHFEPLISRPQFLESRFS